MTNPRGKCCMVWQLKNCANGDMLRFAQMIKDAKVSCVWIKMANGYYADFNSDRLPAAISALNSLGIEVWGWQYIYGANYLNIGQAKAEADAAITNIQRYSLPGWIIDPESEYKRKGASVWADTYMNALRSTFPTLPIGLCSYRFPSYHPELPWQNFLRYCTFHAPQVYWMLAHNPGEQLNRSYQELNALQKLPFIPVGAAYSEGTWTGPTTGELNQFDATAKALNLPGISWWCWDTNGIESHPNWLAAITAHDWGNPLPPPLDWRHAIDQWARTMGYNGPAPEMG